jgi:ATP-dependent DNA ligase
MLYEFSLPTKADQVPTGPDWLHEVKYDGYRMMLVREQERVRLISSGGYDLARRFPLIVEAALRHACGYASRTGSATSRSRTRPATRN